MNTLFKVNNLSSSNVVLKIKDAEYPSFLIQNFLHS